MYGYNTLTETPTAARQALARLEAIAPEKHTTLVRGGRRRDVHIVFFRLGEPGAGSGGRK